MKHDDLVFEALAYRRNVGADPASLRSYISFREKRKRTTKNDLAALVRLRKAGKVVQVGDKWFLTPLGLKLARGSSMRPEWLDEDSLILLTLLLCNRKKGGDLEHIIAVVDYVDRSIPSLEQLHGALNRLVSGGLVKVRRGRYFVTDKASRMFTKVKAVCKSGVRRQLHCLERLMECPCCGVELKKVRWRINIDEAERQEAYQRYIKGFRNA